MISQCYIKGIFIDSIYIYKYPQDEIGTAYFNVQDSHGLCYQVHAQVSKHDLFGNSSVIFSEEFYPIGKEANLILSESSKEIIGEFYDTSGISGIKECDNGSHTLKALPHTYTQKESAIIFGIGSIILLVLYIIFRKYFFKKPKHKK